MAVPDLQDALDCLQRKDMDGAIATLERKIEELPAHLTAHVLLARAHEAKHQWDQALTCWENVYFLMPNSPVAREGKRRVLRRMNGETQTDDEPAEDSPIEEDPSMETPSPPSPPSEEAPEDEEAPTTATEAVSELEQLRRQAENEARQGGARPDLTQSPGPPSSDTPEDRVDQLEDAGDDDLDRLINELESARIEPQPDVDEVPPPDLENDVDDLVSETLARIHEAQDDFRKAAQIYVKLASQEPDQAREFLEKAAELRKKAERNARENENSPS